MVTCEEAKQLRGGINVQGRIEAKQEIRTVTTKFGETKVCDAYLVDGSGKIKLTLWDEDTEKVKNGDMVSIEGGYTTTYRNEIQLNKDKENGKLEVIQDYSPDETPAPPPPQPKLCKDCGSKIGECTNNCECGDCKNRKTDTGITIDYDNSTDRKKCSQKAKPFTEILREAGNTEEEIKDILLTYLAKDWFRCHICTKHFEEDQNIMKHMEMEEWCHKRCRNTERTASHPSKKDGIDLQIWRQQQRGFDTSGG